MPEVRLISVFTHDKGAATPWDFSAPQEINPVLMGAGHEPADAAAKPVREWVKAKSICDLLAREGVTDVIVNGYADVGRLRIIRYCRANGIRCFLFADSNARSDKARGAKRVAKHQFIKGVLGQLDGVMVCGSLGREFFEGYGVDPAHVFYVPYEPDYAQIEGLTTSFVADTAVKLGLVTGRRRIVFSGRLAPEKRVDLLIQAFVAIADERPDWDLVICGDGPLRGALQDQVPSALAPRVCWLGFQGDQSVVSAIYRNCDVLCLPSDHEPWALVVNEAAAAGLALVTSDVVGASAELVRDGFNGGTFRTGDCGDLTRVLRACTAADRIDVAKRGSHEMLASWKAKADPIAGLRQALASPLGRSRRGRVRRLAERLGVRG